MIKLFIICLTLLYNKITFAQLENDIEIELIKPVKSYTVYKNKSIAQKVTFNNNGQQKSVVFYKNGKVVLLQDYFYSNQLLMKMVERNELSKEYRFFTYSYDKKSRILLEIIKSATNKLLSLKSYEYGDNFEIIKSLYNYHGIESSRVEKKYFDSQNPQLVNWVINCELTNAICDSIIYIYDSRNLVIQELDYSQGMLKKINFKHDSKKRKFLEEVANEQNEITRRCYTSYSLDSTINECYKYVSKNDSALVKSEKIRYKDGRIISKESLDFYSTNDEDQDRLQKGKGVKYYYNQFGPSEIITIQNGKIVARYLVKYRP